MLRDVAATEPQEGEVLVRVSSAGMNFADTRARQNLYLRRFELPFIPGSRWPASWSATARASKPASRGGAVNDRGYAEFVATPVVRVVTIPRDRDRRAGAGRAAPRADGVVSLPDRGPDRRRREGRRARRRGRRRIAGPDDGRRRVIGLASTEDSARWCLSWLRRSARSSQAGPRRGRHRGQRRASC